MSLPHANAVVSLGYGAVERDRCFLIMHGQHNSTCANRHPWDNVQNTEHFKVMPCVYLRSANGSGNNGELLA
jgi:hypothetical protein